MSRHHRHILALFAGLAACLAACGAEETPSPDVQQDADAQTSTFDLRPASPEVDPEKQANHEFARSVFLDEPVDATWAPATEQQMRDHVAQFLETHSPQVPLTFDVECRSTMCQTWLSTPDAVDLQPLMLELISTPQEPWVGQACWYVIAPNQLCVFVDREGHQIPGECFGPSLRDDESAP